MDRSDLNFSSENRSPRWQNSGILDLGVNPVRNNSESPVCPDAIRGSSMGSFFSSSTQESNAETRRPADTEIRRAADADSCRRQQLFLEPQNDEPTDSFGWRDDHFPTFQQVDQLRQRFLDNWYYNAVTYPVGNQILLNKFKGNYLGLCKADPKFKLKEAKSEALAACSATAYPPEAFNEATYK